MNWGGPLSEPLRCPQAAARNHLSGYLSGSGSRSESARDHSITCDLAAFKIGIGGSFHISTPLPIAHCPLPIAAAVVPKKVLNSRETHQFHYSCVFYIVLEHIKLSAKPLLTIGYDLSPRKILYVILFPGFSFP